VTEERNAYLVADEGFSAEDLPVVQIAELHHEPPRRCTGLVDYPRPVPDDGAAGHLPA